MRKVTASIEIDGHEGGIGHEPLADPVVRPLLSEEQLVSRFVHQDGEPHVNRSHGHETSDTNEPAAVGTEVGETEQPGPGECDGPDVSPRGNSSEFCAQFGNGHAIHQESLVRENLSQIFDLRDERGQHNAIVGLPAVPQSPEVYGGVTSRERSR